MSKFKVGDKVRYIGGDTPDDPMYLGYVSEMLKDGEVGTITEIKTLSKGVVITVQQDKYYGVAPFSYDLNWLELVEDKPKEPEQPTLFKPGDYVICTDASGSVVAGVLKTGKVYKVKNVSDKGNFITLHGITGSFIAKRFAPLNSTAPTIGGNSPDKVWFDEATTLTLGEQDMSIDTTVAVLNKTYIFGKDADTVTVDDVFNHITRLEAEAAKYDSIKNKPKAIKAKVDALKAEIESLVKFSDEKFSD